MGVGVGGCGGMKGGMRWMRKSIGWVRVGNICS